MHTVDERKAWAIIRRNFRCSKSTEVCPFGLGRSLSTGCASIRFITTLGHNVQLTKPDGQRKHLPNTFRVNRVGYSETNVSLKFRWKRADFCECLARLGWNFLCRLRGPVKRRNSLPWKIELKNWITFITLLDCTFSFLGQFVFPTGIIQVLIMSLKYNDVQWGA